MTTCDVRKLSKQLSPVLAGILLIGPTGCSDPFGADGLGLTISVSDTEVQPGVPVIITVTAMNLGDSVVWGQGSSSCQLGAVVRVGLDEHRIDLRVCTDDLAPQGLGPGESRTEEWPWAGEMRVDDTIETLQPGEYEIRGIAGELSRSGPRTVLVVGASEE
ncbi:MAG: hypothetical protein GTO22_06070 [Gemmatimonadales bacterium]|nr:hypothetical protein [Gemmatimonadales bacterium]